MTPGRWERVEELLSDALDRPASGRTAFLNAECGGDRELLAEVLSLLEAHGRTGAAQAGFSAVRSMLSALESEYYLDRQLGPYKIEAFLGRGGMGQVYRARNTDTDEVVALKVFASEGQSRAELRRSLERECLAISVLRHPNIVAFAGFGEADGVEYLAMELIEGQTLDQLLRRGPIPAPELAAIAGQMAAGLAAAHAAGVIHGDIKPGNVMIDGEGQIKLLDFGLSRSTIAHSAGSERSASLTGAAAFRGTIAYMAPEQIEGKRPDQRSDVFAFGAVLQEMATGERAFRGDTPAATLGAILHLPPRPLRGVARDWRAIIARCLEKGPAGRFQTGAELCAALEKIESHSAIGEWLRRMVLRPPQALLRYAALFAIAATAGFAYWRFTPRHEAAGHPELRRITDDAGLTMSPALSPDGQWVAYASDGATTEGLDIWLQRLPDGEPRRLTSHEADELEPAFSPDGQWIVFRSDRGGGGIYRIRVSGGVEEWLAPRGWRPRYSPDGRWVVYYGTGLKTNRLELRDAPGLIQIIPSGGGKPRPFHPEMRYSVAPVWSPDGKSILFGAFAPGETVRNWWIGDLNDSPARRVSMLPAHTPTAQKFDFARILPQCWLPGGRLVFQHFEGSLVTLMEVPFSVRKAQFTGPPRRISLGNDWHTGPDCGPEGQLVFASARTELDVWGLRREGQSTPYPLTNGKARATQPAFAPDGKSLLYAVRTDRHVTVRRKVLDTAHDRPLGQEKGFGLQIRQSAGSAYLAWHDDRDAGAGLRITTLDGAPVRTVPAIGIPLDLSPDGRFVLWQLKEDRSRIVLQTAGREAVQLILSQPGTELRFARFSPDQQWIVFGTQARNQIVTSYIVPFGGAAEIPQSKWAPAATVPASHAEWAPDGASLYFFSPEDGRLCLWTQRLNRHTKRLLGESEAVHHFHHFRFNVRDVPKYDVGLAVSREMVAFTARRMRAGLWMIQ